MISIRVTFSGVRTWLAPCAAQEDKFITALQHLLNNISGKISYILVDTLDFWLDLKIVFFVFKTMLKMSVDSNLLYLLHQMDNRRPITLDVWHPLTFKRKTEYYTPESFQALLNTSTRKFASSRTFNTATLSSYAHSTSLRCFFIKLYLLSFSLSLNVSAALLMAS